MQKKPTIMMQPTDRKQITLSIDYPSVLYTIDHCSTSTRLPFLLNQPLTKIKKGSSMLLVNLVLTDKKEHEKVNDKRK
jgi:hypothetical protein